MRALLTLAYVWGLCGCEVDVAADDPFPITATIKGDVNGNVTITGLEPLSDLAAALGTSECDIAAAFISRAMAKSQQQALALCQGLGGPGDDGCWLGVDACGLYLAHMPPWIWCVGITGPCPP